MSTRLGRTAEILTEDAVRSSVEFYDDCCVIIPKIQDAVFEKTVDMIRDIRQNWEAGTILLSAAVGISFMIGRVFIRIPLPAIVDRKMIAPILSVFIVKGVAEHGERRRA
ncbi:MAG TPA: hypothetical protein VMW95_02855 [Desulfobacterales bacterium]|nr:hypothetical protein [Desulfobacterales bacterium]